MDVSITTLKSFYDAYDTIRYEKSERCTHDIFANQAASERPPILNIIN